MASYSEGVWDGYEDERAAIRKILERDLSDARKLELIAQEVSSREETPVGEAVKNPTGKIILLQPPVVGCTVMLEDGRRTRVTRVEGDVCELQVVGVERATLAAAWELESTQVDASRANARY